MQVVLLTSFSSHVVAIHS